MFFLLTGLTAPNFPGGGGLLCRTSKSRRFLFVCDHSRRERTIPCVIGFVVVSSENTENIYLKSNVLSQEIHTTDSRLPHSNFGRGLISYFVPPKTLAGCNSGKIFSVDQQLGGPDLPSPRSDGTSDGSEGSSWCPRQGFVGSRGGRRIF